MKRRLFTSDQGFFYILLVPHAHHFQKIIVGEESPEKKMENAKILHFGGKERTDSFGDCVKWIKDIGEHHTFKHYKDYTIVGADGNLLLSELKGRRGYLPLYDRIVSTKKMNKLTTGNHSSSSSSSSSPGEVLTFHGNTKSEAMKKATAANNGKAPKEVTIGSLMERIQSRDTPENEKIHLTEILSKFLFSSVKDMKENGESFPAWIPEEVEKQTEKIFSEQDVCSDIVEDFIGGELSAMKNNDVESMKNNFAKQILTPEMLT